MRVVQNKNRPTLGIIRSQLDKAMNKIQTIVNCPEWRFGQKGFQRPLPV